MDTNVLVSALIQPKGPSAAVFDLFMAGGIDLIVNDAVLAEYEDVLKRPKFGFPAPLVEGAVGYIRSKASRCYSVPQPEPFDDPDDKRFWDLAMSNNAVVVTGNARHFPTSERVMTPREFLEAFAQGM